MFRVLFVLFALLSILLLTLPIAQFSPNRFQAGNPVSLLSLSMPFILAWAMYAMAFSVLLFTLYRSQLNQSVRMASIFYAIALFGILFLFYSISTTTESLILNASPASRISLGSGFWSALLLFCLIALEAKQRLRANKKNNTYLSITAGITMAIIAWWFFQGNFDNLSLMKEFYNHQNRFYDALLTHIGLVAIALVPLFIIASILGWMVWIFPNFSNTIFSVLNFLQTIPSIALFAMLMLPLGNLSNEYDWLKAIGIGGIGSAPAIIAIVLYTLLPLVRNIYTGLSEVPSHVIEAAKAMGMNQWQITFEIMIPLAIPTVLSGVRIVVVQAIGLTVVAALIGAGGLGVFVWEGLGQYAIDLVLLGAIPVILLAILADAVMQGIIRFSRPKGSRIL